MPRPKYEVDPQEVIDYVHERSEVVILMPPVVDLQNFLKTKRRDGNSNSGTPSVQTLQRVLQGGIRTVAEKSGYQTTEVDRVADFKSGEMPAHLMESLLGKVGRRAVVAALIATSTPEEIEAIKAQLANPDSLSAASSSEIHEGFQLPDLSELTNGELTGLLGAVAEEFTDRNLPG